MYLFNKLAFKQKCCFHSELKDGEDFENGKIDTNERSKYAWILSYRD